MPRVDVLLRALGVVRSVLGVGGRYRAASAVGLVIAVGWLVYSATDYGAAAAAGAVFFGTGGDADDHADTGPDCHGDGDDESRTGGRGRPELLALGAVRVRADTQLHVLRGLDSWRVADGAARTARSVVRSPVI